MDERAKRVEREETQDPLLRLYGADVQARRPPPAALQVPPGL